MSNSNNSLSHAYIVPPDGETRAFVSRLVSEMLCTSDTARPCGKCIHCDKVARGIHPDVITITRAEGKRDIAVDQVREITQSALLLPNEARRRVIVVMGAEEMNLQAQNALLKLLEEPPSHLAFILVTDEPGALLPTVRSRCRLLDTGVQAEDVPEHIAALAERYFACALRGGAELCELSFELEKTDKQDLPLLLAEIRRLAAAHIRRSLECGGADIRARKIIDVTRRADEYLSRNVSALHVASLMCCVSEA